MRPKLEHRILQVDGCQIHAVERAPLPGHRARGAKAERDSERAVILIHGAGVDHRDWTFGFMNELTPAWRVLAFDRPGFGHSERTALDGALPMSQARILRRAALDLGVTEAVVVGHSWGGAVAAAWALEGKDQVLGAVSLAGAVMPWSLASSIEHGRRIRHATQLAMSPGGMEQAAMEGMAESFAPQVIPKGYADHMRTHLSMYSGAAMATAADVATVNGALGIQSQRYYALDCPFELVYGDEDRILSVAEQGGAAQSRISQTRLTVLKGAGHMIHHTHTKACHTAIARLCEQADRQAMVPGARSRSAARGAVA
ncbi:MAG: alpha/beta hydrolase [Neomegalonema sp.]|nr:alpha/beta hydrolase [Neomegalonema sp.]